MKTLAVLLLPFGATSSFACPTNYTMLTGRCVRLLNLAQYDPLDTLLPAAREECGWDGAHLPIIRNAEENEGLIQISKSIDEFKGRDALLVLDLVCNNATQRLEWSDGSPLAFKPDQELEVDFDCVETPRTLFSKSSDGQWYHVLTDYNMGWPFITLRVAEPIEKLKSSAEGGFNDHTFL